jgi:hypothetical protein
VTCVPSERILQFVTKFWIFFRYGRIGTGSSDIALAKSGCYSTLTWWVLNHWIVNKQLRFNTGPYEQSSLQCCLQYRHTVSVMTTVFYLQWSHATVPNLSCLFTIQRFKTHQVRGTVASWLCRSNVRGAGSGRITPSLCIEKMHTAFFINLFNKGRTKNIHQKIWSLHTTPTNLTIGEDHINGALCSEDNEIPPSARDHEHIAYLETPSRRNESVIWFNRHLASTSCTRYRYRHRHRTSEQSWWLISAQTLSILPMTSPWRQTDVLPICQRCLRVRDHFGTSLSWTSIIEIFLICSPQVTVCRCQEGWLTRIWWSHGGSADHKNGVQWC